MAKILLQTTIPDVPDDWNVARFSLLADELRRGGHDVVARNRDLGADDSTLGTLDTLDYEQLWLIAVDAGDGLSSQDAAGIMRFHARGGGILTAREDHDVGSSLLRLGPIGRLNHSHVQDPESDARVVASGRSAVTGPLFNLAVCIDTDTAPDGRPSGRVVACSTFHHFADKNWDTDAGTIFKDYVHNIARWLAVGTERPALNASDLRAVQELIDEHFPFDCDVLPIDAHTWAIHGSIPVDGDVILAEFSTKEDAEVALELLSAAEQRTKSRFHDA